MGRALGIFLAFLALAFGMWLRFSEAIRVATLLGWLLAAFVLANIVSICFYYRSHRTQLPLGPLWLRVAGMLVLLLCVAAALAAVDRYAYRIPWHQASGVILDEAGMVFVAYLLGSRLQYKLANILRVGNSTEETLASFKEARTVVSSLWALMAWTLLIGEVVIPFVYCSRGHH